MRSLTSRRLVVGIGASLGTLALAVIPFWAHRPVPAAGGVPAAQRATGRAVPTPTPTPAPRPLPAPPEPPPTVETDVATPTTSQSRASAAPVDEPAPRPEPVSHSPEPPTDEPAPRATPSQPAPPPSPTPTPVAASVAVTPAPRPTAAAIEKYAPRVWADDLNHVCNTERTRFTVSWTEVPGADHYTVRVTGGGLHTTLTTTATVQRFACPAASGKVTFTVVGVDAAGVRESNPGAATVDYTPPLGGPGVEAALARS